MLQQLVAMLSSCVSIALHQYAIMGTALGTAVSKFHFVSYAVLSLARDRCMTENYRARTKETGKSRLLAAGKIKTKIDDAIQ